MHGELLILVPLYHKIVDKLYFLLLFLLFYYFYYFEKSKVKKLKIKCYSILIKYNVIF